MAEYPAMPLWTDAYLADTGHLTTLEHGAYLLLLMTMWRAGGSLPDDDKKLARYARLTAGQWRRIRPTIMEFFKERDGEITQGRLTDELTFVRQHSMKQSDNAKARWLKNKKTGHATALPNGCQTDAPTPTPKRKEEANASSKRRGSRLPSDWSLPAEWSAWALENTRLGPERVKREGEKFRDYWRGLPGQRGVKADWLATWRNWCRKAEESVPATNNRKGDVTTDEYLARQGIRDVTDDERNFSRGGDTGPPSLRHPANDMPGVQPDAEEEARPVSERDVRAGEGAGSLLALRMVVGGV